MSTHHLDIAGKIKDLEAILKEYEIALAVAESKGDTVSAERYRRAIEETENKIKGMRNSPYYNG